MPFENENSIDPLNIPHLDKLIHFIMYFSLTFVFLFDIMPVKLKQIKNAFFFYYFLSILFISGILELIQEFYIPGREGSIIDLIANIFGLFAAVFTYKFIWLKRSNL